MPAKQYRAVLKGVSQALHKQEEDTRRLGGCDIFDGHDDPKSVGLVFEVVTQGFARQPESSTVKYFQEAKLNYHNPLDYGLALEALTAEYYLRRERGRRPVQDAAFVETLRERIRELVSAGSLLPNNHRLAQLCLEKLKDQYPDVTTVSGFTTLLARKGIKASDFTAP